MRAKVIPFLILASVALAQDAESRVFHFHHIAATQDLNEFATLVRTMSEAKSLTADDSHKTMSVSGTPMQIRIAEWLFVELDRRTLPEFATKEFKVPNKEDDVVRVFFLPNAATVQAFQEDATVVRTIGEIRRVFTMNTTRALAVRGTANQLAATEFLARELDQPADAKRTDSRDFNMFDPADHSSDHGATAVRVFYLPYASTIQQFQEVATLTRTIGEIRRVFTQNAYKALIVRATPDQIALTNWIVHELGKPVSADVTASQPYVYPDIYHDGENVVRVFYVKDVATKPAFQQIATQIRTTTKMRRVFTYNASNAIAVRGTEAQLAQTSQILADRQLAQK